MVSLGRVEDTWHGVAVIAAMAVYCASLGLAFLPEPFLSAVAVVFLVLIPLTPVALWKDRRYVRERTGWHPSKLYYLGVIPGLPGGLVLLPYVSRRQRRLARAEEREREPDAVTP